uniref:Wall-associated receptor kinase-like 2 n=1 Tax=Anthurium amnicola TaxID=1678845 RepID=A0A1D1ZB09_9ARAE
MLRGSKTKFLRRNRRLLQEKQAAYFPRISHSPPRLFTAAELDDATGGYHPAKLIKRDAPFELYTATLGGQAVSVKRATPPAGSSNCDAAVEGLITEVVVLSAVGHRNVVKLLGCCLETQSPALVYELHAHGTLQDRASAAAGAGAWEPMSWPGRLRVAAEVTGGLHYLHCHAPLTIFHGDVKPSSVILDEQGVPKIVDFALSTPIASDPTGAADQEQGDVYSLGMLLVVLMLGEQPSQWQDDGGLREGLVARARGLGEAEGNVEQLGAFAGVALECLRPKGEERPTAKEVERRLREIMSFMP